MTDLVDVHFWDTKAYIYDNLLSTVIPFPLLEFSPGFIIHILFEFLLILIVVLDFIKAYYL